MKPFGAIWQELRRRPLAAAIAVLSLTLLLHFPGRAAGDALSTWVSGQVPANYGISSSASAPLLALLMNWIVPFVAAGAVMVTYHAMRSTPRQGARAEIAPGATRSSPDSLQIWFFAAVALAMFSIGEMLLTRPTATSSVPPASAGRDARVDAILQALETRLSLPAPAQSDRDRLAYGDVVKAMARLLWLEFEFEQFERAAAQYDTASEKIFSALKQNTDVQDKEFKLSQNAMTSLAKIDLGQSIDLSRHPFYDQHPEHLIAGEEGIANEADKANYRKYQSQYATAKSTIADLKQQYQDEIKHARWIVFGFAMDPQRQSGRSDEPNRAAPAADEGQAPKRQR